MEAIYEEICRELSLDRPAGSRLERGESPDIKEFVGDHGSVWAPIHVDGIWGCPTCLGSSLLLLEQYYADFDRPAIVERDAIELIGLMYERHGLPLAITNIYGPQCWSVCFPIPDCPECRSAPRQLEDLTRAFRSWRNARSISEPLDTGGIRAATASEFVSANRAAIGFAGIVSNPYDGEDEPHAALLEGLVRTSIEPRNCEVAGGKGVSVEQALASFLGEALERYFVADPIPAATVVGAERELLGALSPEAQFGYPARDETAGVTPYNSDLHLEWLPAEDLASGRRVLVPANLAFCPYLPREPHVSRFSVTTTTGVACGASVEDATLQALLELIERDAFWYFARTGQGLGELPAEALHPYVRAAIKSSPRRFTFQQLPNPFDIPVVHVTYVADDRWDTRTARGIGAAGDIEQASLRAFIECLQILHSLNLGVEVDVVDDDMRHIWFSGEAQRYLPNFFEHSDRAVLRDERPKRDGPLDLHSVLDALSRGAGNMYRVVLADTPSMAVVRVFATGMCLTDATYFSSSTRLGDFASALSISQSGTHIAYAGPTFM